MLEFSTQYVKLFEPDDGVPPEGKTFEDVELEELKAKYDRMPTHVILGYENRIPLRKSTNQWEILNLNTYNKVTAWYDPARMIMRVGYVDSRDKKSIQEMWRREGYDRYTKLEFHMM